MAITTMRYQKLQPEDQVTIRSLKQQNYSIRAIARVLQCPASTISREAQRNGTVNYYDSAHTQQAFQHRRRQSRLRQKLQLGGVLFGVAQHFLRQDWSPEQIALAQIARYPKDHDSGKSLFFRKTFPCIQLGKIGKNDATAYAFGDPDSSSSPRSNPTRGWNIGSK